MAGSLDTTACVLRQRVRSGLTEGPCDLEPHHFRGPVGRGLRFCLLLRVLAPRTWKQAQALQGWTVLMFLASRPPKGKL